MQRAGVVRRTFRLLAAASLCASVACSDDDGSNTSQSPATGSDAGLDGAASDTAVPDAALSDAGPQRCPVMVNEAQCDRTKRPIVFVHGTYANADSFAHPAMLLASNGYCADWIRGIEYNSLISFPDAGASDAGIAIAPGLDGGALDAGIAAASDGGLGDGGGLPPFDLSKNYMRAKAAIDEAIEQLRKETGFDKVDLLGHSQGAAHGARYAGENPDKVATYVNLAGGELAADPSGVPTLCLSSTGDRPAHCGTTKNVIFMDDMLDHSGVASSTEAFIEIYKFYNNGEAPKYTTIQCGDPIMLQGRAPTLSDNTFLPGSKIEVYEVGSEPRTRGTPVTVFNIGADGNFGPWQAKPDVQYEFKLVAPAGDTLRTSPIRGYMRPFIRSNRLMRFNFQSADPSANSAGQALNANDSHAIIIPRRLQKAFMYPRDSLKVDGFEVITADNTLNPMTGRSTVTAALYLYDVAPGDGMSTGKKDTSLSGAFVTSADVFMQAMTPAFITVVFHESTTNFMSTLKIPNWPSATEGVSVVFVDCRERRCEADGASAGGG